MLCECRVIDFLSSGVTLSSQSSHDLKFRHASSLYVHHYFPAFQSWISFPQDINWCSDDEATEIQSNIHSANNSNTADESLATPDLEAQLSSAPIDLQSTTPIPNNSSNLTTDTNVTPTMLQSLPPQKGLRRTPKELQAKLKAGLGRTSSVTRHLSLDSAPMEKKGLHGLH
jgi:hypothetical protein